ncbi:unnamed protein product, partial [Laminaria digitata]
LAPSPPPPPPCPAFFPQAAGNGLSWQSNNDIPSRREILGKIVTYLQQRKPNPRPEWIQKVR